MSPIILSEFCDRNRRPTALGRQWADSDSLFVRGLPAIHNALENTPILLVADVIKMQKQEDISLRALITGTWPNRQRDCHNQVDDTSNNRP